MLSATFSPGPGTRPFSRRTSTARPNRSVCADVWKSRAQQAPRQPQQQQQQQQSDSSQPSTSSFDGNGTADGQGKASSDVLRLFSETQRNLLELNRSRLSALDELRAAKNKISALENKLEQASTAAPAEKASPQLPEAVPEIEQEAQPAEPIPQPVAQNTITVAYQTGWKRVMLHYRADGLAWTDLPGVQMQSGSDDLAGYKVMQVRGNKIEFVLNDGSGQWDTPDPYGAGQSKNYRIDTPGTYRLKDGRVSKLK